eukprot:CAMPEP_0198553972 /NCGR_PEP_ID=MMETSP1462-20131121/81568_1 /TAXON_ID=1333877 /ORGANISM="Brandtodinium nutriculum, Strain RCC3387" /LENGTH=58 /DNA_ID=CAMNT_0044284663 /DNA_START=29 /DNA_END=201 /DNA_ORIENTATION=+
MSKYIRPLRRRRDSKCIPVKHLKTKEPYVSAPWLLEPPRVMMDRDRYEMWYGGVDRRL